MKRQLSRRFLSQIGANGLLFRALCLLLVIFICPNVSAQETPLALYDFDALDLSESTGNYSSGSAKAIDLYDCGVGSMSNALLFEGGTDTICLDPQVKELFDDNFSLSFYFWPRTGVDSYTLFSIQNNCERDSSLNIRYTSQGELRIEYSSDASESVRFSHQLDPNFCWHQVVFTRSGTTYSFYIDGAFIESITFLDDIAMGKNHPVYVGYSDCVGRFDEHYTGRIDEIAIYDNAIDENAIKLLDLRADKIVSQDTTIFQGDTYNIITGTTCATDVRWSPVLGLDDPSSLRPVASPDETTTYTVEFDNGSCTSTDTVKVSVVKTDDIDCGRLLLPRAFTPNEDALNDEFGISNGFIISDLKRFEIFDRWGMKLFDTSNKAEVWDGKFRGQNMTPGTYVYKIEYECLDENYQKTGSFNLIK